MTIVKELKYACCGILGVCAGVFGLQKIGSAIGDKLYESKIKAHKEYVRTHAPERYVKELERDISFFDTEGHHWKKVSQSVRDSLAIDSVAKTNYAKGAQMVRDSIKTASKVIR